MTHIICRTLCLHLTYKECVVWSLLFKPSYCLTIESILCVDFSIWYNISDIQGEGYCKSDANIEQWSTNMDAQSFRLYFNFTSIYAIYAVYIYLIELNVYQRYSLYMTIVITFSQSCCKKRIKIRFSYPLCATVCFFLFNNSFTFHLNARLTFSQQLQV